MSKIHLIIMPSFANKEPHLGIACLSAYLKQQGVDLTFTDFRSLYNCNPPFSYLGYTSTNYVPEIPDLPLILSVIKNYNRGKELIYAIDGEIMDYVQDRRLNYFSLKKDIENIYKVMKDNIGKFTKHDIIGLTTYETNFLYTIMLSLLIRQKRPDTVIIYGGAHVSQHISAAKLALKSTAADKIVIGEGEETLTAIIYSKNKKKDFITEGVMRYDKKKNTFIYQARKPMDLNRLPCPDFSIFQTGKHPFFKLPLYSSRGCTNSCSFCNEWTLFFPYRRVTHTKLIENMKYMYQKYNAIRFEFADSLLNGSLGWLERFAEGLLKQNLNLQWGGFFRSRMPKNLLKKLKKSGLSFAFIGSESFSDRILASMGKKRNVADNLKTIELFCSLNIPIVAGIIIGFPSSTKSEFLYMWRSLLSLNRKYLNLLKIHIEPFQLRPKSGIYNNPGSYGISLIKYNTKIRQLVPELSDIVEKVPMAISGRPKTTDIIQRFNLITRTFSEQPYPAYFTETDKEFRKQILNYIKPSCKIKIPRDHFQIHSLASRPQSRDNIFLLKWNSGKYILTGEECFMLDHFDGRTSLSEISKKLSFYFNSEEKICYQTILNFINELVARDFQFNMSF